MVIHHNTTVLVVDGQPGTTLASSINGSDGACRVPH
jgi:hypothetical protein